MRNLGSGNGLIFSGGGNFHLFANGDAFMSSLIQSENPSYTAQQIKDLFRDYENVNLTIYPGFPTSFDSTQHIDMWMLAVGDNKVIIGEYASSTGQPYTITENAVADLTARGYTVYRTPGWNPGSTTLGSDIQAAYGSGAGIWIESGSPTAASGATARSRSAPPTMPENTGAATSPP